MYLSTEIGCTQAPHLLRDAGRPAAGRNSHDKIENRNNDTSTTTTTNSNNNDNDNNDNDNKFKKKKKKHDKESSILKHSMA